MAIVSSDLLAGLLTGYRAIAMEAMEAVKPDYPKIATEFPSLTDKETYAWLGATPAMSEWLDERKIYGALGFDYTLTNKHFEGTLAVDRNTLEDDKYDLIKPLIQDLAQRAARYPDELVISLLTANGKAFDGTAFFADTRVIGDSANIDNLLAGAGVTEANIRTDIGQAIVALGGFQDARGKVMNLITGAAPLTIVCPLNLLVVIRSALLPGVAGVKRIEAEFVEHIIGSPILDATDATDWYALITNRVLKPLIFQNRQKPQFVALDDPKSPEAFLRKRLLYGIDMRCNAGYGDPRLAVKIVNA